MEVSAAATSHAIGPIALGKAGTDDLMMRSPAVPGRKIALLGGVILFVLGLFLVVIGISATTAPQVEGISISSAVALFAFAFAVPPLIVAVGVLYGVLFLAQGMRSQPIPGLVGALFLGAAVALLDSLRRRSSP